MSELEKQFRDALKSQYKASLEMMRRCIQQCSDELWLSQGAVNPFWRVAYHTQLTALFSSFLNLSCNCAT